eukprot:CAMPEP_0119118976 /NCGR_PEP_ID=MMETSP1310-20130426/674_1 /TAXON_ID=464262 /ORGANISM="Genus nov. species nov., Strain RCC2339" /LENGTH=329 /DNA_ID=CAMNT_0007108385 /DNA_START=52 /DNA_END=1041 /DNA_ORIENTATION=+
MASIDVDEIGDTRVDTVQIDGVVVMKIIKHCKEKTPELVTGQLLGLDVGSNLEVTNCFPFPDVNEALEEGEGEEYQMEMMRCLRDVNVDSNTVGWYQSTYMGSFMKPGMIESQFHYQANIRKCVVVVYDPVKSGQGHLALQAFRLTNKFMKLFQDQAFSPDIVTASGISHGDLFEEIPIKIHNSQLINAMLHDLDHRQVVPKPEFARLAMTSNTRLEKSLEVLIDESEELIGEHHKLQYYHRALQRQQQQQQKWIQQRKLENAKRRRNGESELPEKGDESDPLWKPIPPPSQLDSLLHQSQLGYFCDQTNQLVGASLNKHYMLSSLHKD